jgi:beta-glucosidase/6-phospho-beta-glucosidase/beta-galactosidase
LDYGNKFYNDGGYPSTDKEILAFSRYASWTAQRFKGNVKYYEIWNEWTIGTGMVKFRKAIQ